MFNSYRTNTLRFDPARCTNCQACLLVCPHGVFIAGKPTVVLAYPQRCMECGACQINCSRGAITVESGVGCASAMIGAALRGKKIDQREECT